jgi:FkbM family methyltransferase
VRCLASKQTPCTGCWWHRDQGFVEECHARCKSLESLPAAEVYDEITSILRQLQESSANGAPAPVQAAGVWVHGGWLGRLDLQFVREVLEEDCYRVADLPTTGDDREFVVDVGAHIGCFALAWRRRNPSARVFCVEVCPEHIPVLEKNVGAWATVVPAACSYEAGDFVLHNSLGMCSVTTGSSRLAPRGSRLDAGGAFWEDTRPLLTITLEELLDLAKARFVHVLKLDCEGAEFSILSKTKLLARVRTIVGEFHNHDLWRELLKSRFRGWRCTELSRHSESQGTFRLDNPRFKGPT